MDAPVENKQPGLGPRTKPRRRNSVKCTLKTKSGPKGIPAVKKKPPDGIAFILNPDVYTVDQENNKNELGSILPTQQQNNVLMEHVSSQKTIKMLNDYDVQIVTGKSASGSVSMISTKPAVSPIKPKIAPRPVPPGDKKEYSVSTVTASQGRMPKLKSPGFEIQKLTSNYKPVKPKPVLNKSSPKNFTDVPEKTVSTEKETTTKISNTDKKCIEPKSSVADMAAIFGGIKPKVVSKPKVDGSVFAPVKSPPNVFQKSDKRSSKLRDSGTTGASSDSEFSIGAKLKDANVTDESCAKTVAGGEKSEAKSNIDIKLTESKTSKKKVPPIPFAKPQKPPRAFLYNPNSLRSPTSKLHYAVSDIKIDNADNEVVPGPEPQPKVLTQSLRPQKTDHDTGLEGLDVETSGTGSDKECDPSEDYDDVELVFDSGKPKIKLAQTKGSSDAKKRHPKEGYEDVALALDNEVPLIKIGGLVREGSGSSQSSSTGEESTSYILNSSACESEDGWVDDLSESDSIGPQDAAIANQTLLVIKARTSFKRKSADVNTMRRRTAPKPRFWSNPERQPSTPDGYEIVEPVPVIPSADWETDSDPDDGYETIEEPTAPVPKMPRSPTRGQGWKPLPKLPVGPSPTPREKSKGLSNKQSSHPGRKQALPLPSSAIKTKPSQNTSGQGDVDGDSPPLPPPRLESASDVPPPRPPKDYSRRVKELLVPPCPPRSSSTSSLSLPEQSAPQAPPRSHKPNKSSSEKENERPISEDCDSQATAGSNRGPGNRGINGDSKSVPKLPPRKCQMTCVGPTPESTQQKVVKRAKSEAVLDVRKLASIHERPPAPLPRLHGDSPGGSINLLQQVPPPPDDIDEKGSGYILPDHADSHLVLTKEGYIPMEDVEGTEAYNAKRSSHPPRKQSAAYIDPKDIDSHPDPSTPEPFRDLWSITDFGYPRTSYCSNASDGSAPYLMLDDGYRLGGESGDYEGQLTRDSHYCSLFSDEPLYQIYQQDVVCRESWRKKVHTDSDEESSDDFIESFTCDEYEDTVPVPVKDKGMTASDPEAAKPTAPRTIEVVHKSDVILRTLWCETPRVKDSGVLDTLSMQEKKLQEALFEVMTSEASYLKSLDLLVKHFMMADMFNAEKRDQCPISRRDKHVLFSNILAVRSVSEKFLSEMETVWENNLILSAEMTQIIADFANKDFDVYVKYCSNQVYQERKLKHLQHMNQQFRDRLWELERNPQCQGLSMQSFLMLPMQRITRMPLLVDAICHRMDPHHPHYHIVSAALQVLNKAVKQCNEGARQMANLEQITQIDKTLEFKNVKKIPLVSQSRYLVKKGQLTRISKDASKLFTKSKQTLYFFLFNDLLLVTKKKSEGAFTVVDYASRISVHSDLIDEDNVAKYLPNGMPGGCKNLFLMALLENHEGKHVEFVLSCDSPSERTRWVEAVTPACQENEDERIYESWDCPQVQAIHQYVAKEPDELSLEESDVINVFRKIADGWYEGERIRDGQRGWFPANYTVEIQSAHVRAKNLRQRYRLLALSHEILQKTVHRK